MSPPRARKKNILTTGNARFTLLSDRMLRLEWAEDGQFEDLATLAVCDRRTPAVPHSAGESDGSLVVRTDFLTLEFTPDGKPFHKRNLTIRLELNGETVEWWPGKTDKHNLKGTAKTLDGASGGKRKKWIAAKDANPDKPVLANNNHGDWIWQGDEEDVPLCDGLISRSGWAVVDDSTSVVLDPDLCDWQPWVRERPKGKRRDLYFLGHGHDYKAALRDAQRVFGRQPLPPRYALGYWYSRYWAYTDKELMRLVEDFDSMDLPLDVLVIDMDWHKLGWTGYSWDPDYFPDPARLLKWLRDRDVKITLNLHPADGVFDFEDAFPDMLKEMGLKRDELPDLEPRYHRLYEMLELDPSNAKRIPLDVCDPTYMRAYFNCLHHPQEKMGVDFWWMDWQQGSQGSTLPNLDTLPWINELHWRDQEWTSPHKRPINFSRFGGIGAGRMPVGFSGDTHVNWDSLAFQPWFTATASNVLYGTWSHDIGGHMCGTLTPELYTRWIQFGIYSPVFRTHTSKSTDCERRVFHFPDPHRSVMMDMMRRRYELVPYIYGEMRKAWDSGVSLLRPMYYDWPEEESAYRAKDQYMFGDRMLVAPVTRPLDPEDEMAEVSVWLPEGGWFDTAWGGMVEGGRMVARRYVIGETPVFVRPGTVIPEQTATRRLGKGAYPELVFRIYPGKSGEGALYEDDGVSTAWMKGGALEIRCSHAKKRSVRSVKLHPVKGKYKGFKKQRRVILLLEGFAPPREVSEGDWSYEGDTATLRIDLGTVNLKEGLELTVTEPGNAVWAKTHHLRGLMTRLEKVRAYNCQVSPPNPVHKDERLAVEAAQTGRRITLNPETFSKEIKGLRTALDRLPAALAEYEAAFRDPGADGPNVKELTLRKARGILETTKGL